MQEIFSKKEWQEIQAMQERAEEKRKAEEKNKKYKKKLRLKKNIKENINNIILDLLFLINIIGFTYVIILLDTLLKNF